MANNSGCHSSDAFELCVTTNPQQRYWSSTSISKISLHLWMWTSTIINLLSPLLLCFTNDQWLVVVSIDADDADDCMQTKSTSTCPHKLFTLRQWCVFFIDLFIYSNSFSPFYCSNSLICILIAVNHFKCNFSISNSLLMSLFIRFSLLHWFSSTVSKIAALLTAASKNKNPQQQQI